MKLTFGSNRAVSGRSDDDRGMSGKEIQAVGSMLSKSHLICYSLGMNSLLPFAAMLLGWASPSAAKPTSTDFGIRTLGQQLPRQSEFQLPFKAPSLTAATRVGAAFGTVTSTYRSLAHNRAVGGVANSFHLRGRAMDIARRPGVSHLQLEAALRTAGYSLIESLDEGDHSHFAFGNSGAPLGPIQSDGNAQWRVVHEPATDGALTADIHGALLVAGESNAGAPSASSLSR